MTVNDQPARPIHQRGLELAAVALDFELTREEATELATHLASCPVCARRATGMRTDALALRRPLGLLPSARVDAAIAAEIAGRRARPQRLVLVAVAALLALALLGAAAIGSYVLRDLQNPPLTVVPTSVPVAVVSPDPSVAPAVLGETWQQIDFAPGSGGSLEAVTFDGAKLVGVGRGGCVPDFNDPTHCYGAAWTAALGSPWVRAADQPGLEVGLERPTSGPDKGIFDVAAGPAGIVAIGHQFADIGPGIWHSPDGQAWERVSIGSNVVDDFFVAIAPYPKGYVMVGRAVDYGALTAHAAAWLSPDGLTWTRVEDTPAMDVGPCLDTGEEPACGGMHAVIWTGTSIVAVGETRTDRGTRSHPAAWTSQDGREWTRTETGLDFDGQLSGLTAGGPGLVAIGTICQPTCVGLAGGVAATSRDGSTWTVTPIAGSAALADVASAGGSLFAVGSPSEAMTLPATMQVWRSADGVSWRRLDGPPAIPDAVSFGALDLTAAGDRIAIGGWAETRSAEGVTSFAYLSPPAAAGSGSPVEPSALPSATPSAPAEPSSIAPPSPVCPAPAVMPEPPAVAASAGGRRAVVATLGSYTTMTCSTVGTSDAGPITPSTPLVAQRDETITVRVPTGWQVVHWEGSDAAVAGGEANVWPSIELPGPSSQFEVPVPNRAGDSNVILQVAVVSPDGRVVMSLTLHLLVRVQ